jgi:hypothetical protein
MSSSSSQPAGRALACVHVLFDTHPVGALARLARRAALADHTRAGARVADAAAREPRARPQCRFRNREVPRILLASLLSSGWAVVRKPERCQVGPKDASWPMHSCGNTAIKGCSWPNFWACLGCFSLRRLCGRAPREPPGGAGLAANHVRPRAAARAAARAGCSATVHDCKRRGC